MSVRRLAADAVQPPSFAFTPENQVWAQQQIAKFPPGRQASAVIPLLWRAQEQHDYWLPKAAIEHVASMLGMPNIRVLEVATFYTMFNLEPVGRHFIQLCGTTPCRLSGAEDIIKVCQTRIGDQRKVTPDGKFSWLEVECLGSCCNAPMVQINNDYYEDLTPESFNKLLDDLAAGRPVKPGPQNGRRNSEPEGGAQTLTDPTLFDGSLVGAWKKRFAEEEEKARQAAAAKAAEDAAKAEAAKAEAAKAEALTAEAARAAAAAEAAKVEAEKAAAEKAEAARAVAAKMEAEKAEVARVNAASAEAAKVEAARAAAASEAAKMEVEKAAAARISAAAAEAARAGAERAEAARPETSGAASDKALAAAAVENPKPARPPQDSVLKAVDTPAARVADGKAPVSDADRARNSDPAVKIGETVGQAPSARVSTAATQPVLPPVGDEFKPELLTAPRDGKGDDLELIWGVGPKLADLLHRLGVFHFSQIASWNEMNLRWIDQNLGSFKGRAVRDKWIEQSAKLASGWRPENSIGDKPQG